MKYNSVEEWRAEAARRFGPDMLKWKFRCPMCGHVASVKDFKDAGAKSPKEGDSSGCNWAAYGFFGIPREHDLVVADDGKVIDVYPLANSEQESDNG